MHVRRLDRQGDVPEWLRMRDLLWPDNSMEENLADLEEMLADEGWAIFVCERTGEEQSGLCGFAELSTRVDYVEGCETSPVGYVEGWFVDEDVRRQGIGARLFAAGEAWARDKGYVEIGSDAELWNELSIIAHQRLGYEIAGRNVHFRKLLTK